MSLERRKKAMEPSREGTLSRERSICRGLEVEGCGRAGRKAVWLGERWKEQGVHQRGRGPEHGDPGRSLRDCGL